VKTSTGSFWKRPATRLGWWAVGLAAASVALLVAGVVVVAQLDKTQPGPWIEVGFPLYFYSMLLCALAGAVLGLIAVIWKRERSWLAWLALLPGAFALMPAASQVVFPLLGGAGTAPSALEPIPPHVVAADARPFVIDTDMAADDWLAILYLLGRSDVDVKAITVTGAGEAHCAAGTRNALGLAALAGRPEIPVACGRETPLAGSHTFPAPWREAVDDLFGLTLPVNSRPPASEPAAEMLRRIVRESPQKVHLVVLGPLTNVAEALAVEPALADDLERITVMGGALEVPGNVVTDPSAGDPVAEWNIYVDPQAAAQVLSSGAPITLVPLDATNAVPLTVDFLRRLEGDRTTSVAEFVYRVLQAQEGRVRSGSYYFWDPLAAAIATERGLGTFREMPVVVHLGEGAESGRTLQGEGGPLVRVAVTADQERFEALFLDAVNGRLP
jgi:pyrimidine-specific ribonucleoside hydrolase